MKTIVLIYLAAINLLTFLTYGVDKWKARKGSWRISESALLMLAVAGGSVGALLGMQVWHHKTRHKKFRFGVPVVLILQLALAVYLIKYMNV